MKRTSSGYTLIEALMVVAISSTIFLGAATLFNGRRHTIDFGQAVSDLQSKMRSYATEVSTGVFRGNTTHSCSQHAITLRPTLTEEAGMTINSNQDCIYLGKAIQLINGTSTLYIYDVLGLRNVHSGTTDTDMPVTSIAEARPEAAGTVGIAPGSFSFLFVDKYELLNGATVVSAKRVATASNILKIYANMQSGASSTRGINAYTHDYPSVPNDQESTRLRNCINETGLCSTAQNIDETGWDLCIQSADGSQRSKLSLKPTLSGIVTTTSDEQCT